MALHKTREAWLQHAVRAMSADLFAAHEIEVPEIQLSVGWPKGARAKKGGQVVGQCFNTTWTGSIASVFIAPTIVDPVEVLACLGHELIHAWDDCASGHRGAFNRTFRKLGYVGKATEIETGDELKAYLTGLAAKLGDYPHVKMTVRKKGLGEKKQTTRMLKIVCEDCEYQVRTTKKWIEVGLPTCPCGTQMTEV
jgi:hypothetical protein